MEFTWNVVQMDRLTSDGFVVTVHYTVNAVDGNYNASTYGTVGYTQGEGSYVPFANLTKEQVIGWVQDSLGKNTVEAGLTAQIEAQKNPVQEAGVPWATLEAPI
jgi:hypothetical protein